MIADLENISRQEVLIFQLNIRLFHNIFVEIRNQGGIKAEKSAGDLRIVLKKSPTSRSTVKCNESQNKENGNIVE